MAKEDKPDQSSNKSDLYAIIKRRGRTVASYLEAFNLNTKKEVSEFIKLLNKDFFISELFMKEVEVFLESKVVTEVSAPVVEEDVQPTVTKPKKKKVSKKQSNTPEE